MKPSLDALQQISLTRPDLDVWSNHDAQIQGEFSRSRLQFRAPLAGSVINAPVYSQATQSARQGCDGIPVLAPRSRTSIKISPIAY
jgi:hypothetical protein